MPRPSHDRSQTRPFTLTWMATLFIPPRPRLRLPTASPAMASSILPTTLPVIPGRLPISGSVPLARSYPSGTILLRIRFPTLRSHRGPTRLLPRRPAVLLRTKTRLTDLEDRAMSPTPRLVDLEDRAMAPSPGMLPVVQADPLTRVSLKNRCLVNLRGA